VRGRALIASAALLLSCRRVDVLAKKDPTPPVDAAPPVDPVRPGLACLHGRVVDVRDGSVLHVLREKRPLGEAVIGDRAYTLDEDRKLRTWNPANGQLVSEQAKVADVLSRDGGWLVLTGPMLVEAFHPRDGFITVSATGAGIEEGARVREGAVARVGTRMLFGSATYHAPAPIESVIENHRRGLAARGDAICFAMFAPPNHRVECLDSDGSLVRSVVVALARPADAPGTRFHTRFISPHHIVIGTWSFGGLKSTRRAAVARLVDGNVTIVEDEIAAAVERSDGTLEGLLVTTPEVKLLAPNGSVRWTHKPPRTDSFAAVALVDDRLVIATYNAIATGVDVFALDVRDGKLLWTGETKLPPIGHSKYRNAVTLEVLADAVIVRGDESSVKHVHVYDSKTGALRFSDAQ